MHSRCDASAAAHRWLLRLADDAGVDVCSGSKGFNALIISDQGGHTGQVWYCPCAGIAAATAVGVGPGVRAPAFVEAAEVLVPASISKKNLTRRAVHRCTCFVVCCV
jgi:hypothetical protein